jgi:hypothetical protein
VRDSALVLSNLDGTYRPLERCFRRFVSQVVQARKALGEQKLPAIRLHDLRHTHATLLLADGVPVKVVSERLGRASATITLNVYQHVHPGMGRQAADRFAALLEGRPEVEASRRDHKALSGRNVKRPGSLTCRDPGAMWCPGGTWYIRTRLRVSGETPAAARE